MGLTIINYKEFQLYSNWLQLSAAYQHLIFPLCLTGMIPDQFPVVGPHTALSSRAQLVSGRFYSCCLLLFPGIYRRTLSQGATEPVRQSQ